MKQRGFLNVRALALAAGSLLAGTAMAVTTVVPGTANPYLAGRAADFTCCDLNGGWPPADTMGTAAPVLLDGSLPMAAGTVLQFTVSGETLNTPGAGSGNNPDGTLYPSDLFFDFVDGISGPTQVQRINGLFGVFLGNASPTGTAPPAELHADGKIDFAALSPLVGQVFFIGDGLTSDSNAGDFSGVRQSFVVPVGATRLYLGTSDGFGWNNNSGSFQVEVTSAVPEPASAGLLAAGLLGGILVWRRRSATPGDTRA